jgi:ArsR family transcriptional regulator, arsenate/arsenite/antimonite-responsive transcriptional repressor
MSASRSPFEALADATRRSILKRLRSGSLTAGEIAETFQLTKPTLSHHFRILKRAGLVRSHRQGTNVIYTLQANVIEELAAELLELTDGARRLVGHTRSKGVSPENPFRNQ